MKLSCKHMWIAASAAATTAALYLIRLVWVCSPDKRKRCDLDQGPSECASKAIREALLKDRDRSAAEEPSDFARGSPGQQGFPEIANATAQQEAKQSASLLPEFKDVASSLLLPSKDASAEERARCGSAEPLPSAAPHPDAPNSGRRNIADILQPAVVPDATDQPVDEGYLKDMIEHELGPPKFSVPRKSKGQQEGASSHEANLKALLDREFGPPKFAVQKQVAPAPCDDAMGGGAEEAAEGSADGDSAHGRPALPERTSLQLEVTAGPAVGRIITLAEDQTEMVIGRLPDNMLTILDQEVSGRHATIKYSAKEECWQVVDMGSLNGSVLNGMIISTNDRRPGEHHVLADQDVLELGGVSKIKVTCGSPPAQPSKRRAAAQTWGGPGSKGTAGTRLQFYTTAKLPPLLVAEEQTGVPGLRLALHQRLGADHLRTSKPIEDVAHHECPFGAFGAGSGLFCVFDGHNGSEAAQRAKALVPGVLAAKLTGDGDGALIFGRPAARQAQLLHEAFLEADAQISSDEGCTATVVLVQQGLEQQLAVQVANVGDSSAVVINATKGTWSKLSADHRIANSSAERQRLLQRGHTVKKRLYGLNISRMLGDKFLKDEDLGFIAEPHVSPVEQLPASARCFVIVASDGLWDVLSEERAAGLVLKAFSDDPDTTSADLVADILLSQAISLRSSDDVTIMVLEKQAA